MKEFSFKNKYNDTLLGNMWEIENPKGIILLVTGMAEHSARYDEFATFLNKNGYSVYCLDHYGQGKNGELMNPGKDYFFKYIETMKDVNKVIKTKFNNLPLINIAHSMGSFILQGYIEKYSTTIDKAILIGTNGKNPLVPLGNCLAKLLIHDYNYNKKAKFFHNLSIGAYVKSVKERKRENEWLSYNEENVTTYDNDPLCGVLPTNGFYKEFLAGLASIQKEKNVDNISKDLDILIIGGKDDPVGNFSKGLRKLFNQYKSHNLNVSLKIYDNMRHEILNEKEHVKVYIDILSFINGIN